MLVEGLGELGRDLAQDFDKFLVVELEQELGVLVGTRVSCHGSALVLHHELVFVHATHNVVGQLLVRRRRRTRVQAENLRQVVKGEEVAHMFLHVEDPLRDARHLVVVNLRKRGVLDLSLFFVPLIRLNYDFLDSQVIQVFALCDLENLLLGSRVGHSRLVDDILIDELVQGLLQDVSVLLVDEFAAVVKFSDQVPKHFHGQLLHRVCLVADLLKNLY